MAKRKLLLVCGDTRSGKSTLGRELADALDWYHMETSRPLRRLFNLPIYEWEQQKDLPAFGKLDVTLRSLAIAVADQIGETLGPDGYARVVAAHLPPGNTVLSGVRKMDEVTYFTRAHGAKAVWVSDERAWEQAGPVLFFPKTYTMEDIERLLEELEL